VQPAAGFTPLLDDLVDPTRSGVAAEHIQQGLARLALALGDDGDSPVREVASHSNESEFERAGPRPPPKAHTLHVAVHQKCDACHPNARNYHVLLPYRPVISSRRRGASLLIGIATGSLLLGGVAQAAPGTALTPSTPSSAQAVAAALPDAAPTDWPSGSAAAVVAETNKERRDAGCRDVKPDSRLNAAAQAHAEDMAEEGYFSHTSEDGTAYNRRMADAGYPRPGGENIAKGQTSASQVVDEWMDSPGHRKNIENCSYRTIGVGYVGDEDIWVQDFGF